MHGGCIVRGSVLAILAIILICLVATIPAQAGNTIPWMTGTFPNGGAYSNFGGGTSPDGKWWFGMSFSPTIQYPDLNWTCADVSSCYGYGYSSITGGTVTGNLYDTTSWIQVASFSGFITGGTFFAQAWGPVWPEYWDQAWFDFSGAWTNGLSTTGYDYTTNSIDAAGGWFTITTVTPEPGTIGLVGLGIVGLYSRLRRRS